MAKENGRSLGTNDDRPKKPEYFSGGCFYEMCGM